MTRTFWLSIDSDDDFIKWLLNAFDGDSCNTMDPAEFGVVPVVVVEDARGSDERFARDMPFYQRKDGKIGWYDPDESSITFTEKKYTVEELCKDLEGHESRQSEDDE